MSSLGEGGGEYDVGKRTILNFLTRCNRGPEWRFGDWGRTFKTATTTATHVSPCCSRVVDGRLSGTVACVGLKSLQFYIFCTKFWLFCISIDSILDYLLVFDRFIRLRSLSLAPPRLHPLYHHTGPLIFTTHRPGVFISTPLFLLQSTIHLGIFTTIPTP